MDRLSHRQGGERFVLSGEAFLFFFACLGYAFAEDLFSGNVAIFFIYVCYVVDFSLDSVYMARTTYMRKIALIPEDVSPSLSLGTSLDHLVTIFLPILGGLVWYNAGPGGYKYVFMGGAFIAVVNFVSSRMIDIREGHPRCWRQEGRPDNSMGAPAILEPTALLVPLHVAGDHAVIRVGFDAGEEVYLTRIFPDEHAGRILFDAAHDRPRSLFRRCLQFSPRPSSPRLEGRPVDLIVGP